MTEETGAAGQEPTGPPCPDAGAGAGAVADALLLALVGASLGTLLVLLAFDVVRPAYLLGNWIEPDTRQPFFRIVVTAALGGVALAAALHAAARRATDAVTEQARLSQRLSRLRPPTLVWPLPILLEPETWIARPLFLLFVSFAAAVLLSFWLRRSWLLRARARARSDRGVGLARRRHCRVRPVRVVLLHPASSAARDVGLRLRHRPAVGAGHGAVARRGRGAGPAGPGR